MNEYYLEHVVKPLFKLNIKLFNTLLGTNFNEEQCSEFIAKIKLTKEKIKNFNKFLLENGFKKTKIEKNQLLVNAEYIDMSELTDISKIDNKFFEFTNQRSYTI